MSGRALMARRDLVKPGPIRSGINCIVAGGTVQRDTASRADWLYVGQHHRSMLNWALSVYRRDELLILSSRWGLVTPGTFLWPYTYEPVERARGLDTDLLAEQARTYQLSNVVAYAGGVQYIRPLLAAGIKLRPVFRGDALNQIAMATRATSR